MARKRRRNVLAVLAGGVALTFGLALFVNPLFWIANVVVDVLLAVYLYLLFLVTRHGFHSAGDDEFWSSTPDSRTTGSVAHPRVPPRPELAPMHRGSKPRRSAAG